MSGLEKNGQYYTHSRRSILASTAVAAGIAAIILVIIVLPVEYNIDPTGIGGRLGLTGLAAAKTEAAPVTAVPGSQQQTPDTATTPVTSVPENQPITPDDEWFVRSSGSPFRSETIEIPLQGDEELEYKFNMEKGQVLVYTWSSGNRDLYYEFHAEPTEGEYPEDYYMSYEIGDGVTGASGSLVAPFTGRHGWYFLNLTQYPVTVKLQVSGYYDSHGRLF